MKKKYQVLRLLLGIILGCMITSSAFASIIKVTMYLADKCQLEPGTDLQVIISTPPSAAHHVKVKSNGSVTFEMDNNVPTTVKAGVTKNFCRRICGEEPGAGCHERCHQRVTTPFPFPAVDQGIIPVQCREEK